MNLSQIDRYCDLFEQRLQRGEEITVDRFMKDQHLPGDAALVLELQKVFAEYLSRIQDLPQAAIPGQLDPRIRVPLLQARDASVGMIVGGRYKLVESIGSGGMGTVWLAEQREPVRRKVAVKLIKAGMDSQLVLARFEAERQALALMDHPNIAKVFDGGTTDQGRPFFVMEYVKGVPLTDYCDQVRLSLKERLDLFILVCQAVQHAHQKGIIHRDLKPSNLLVCLYDGNPVPKVIDFGLAKAMHQSLTDLTMHTAHGMLVGTARYVSPEQAELNNLDVDTRTDIYSLGVILYELLTGTTPLERQQLKQVADNEVVRLIKEVEPPKPSTRLSGSDTLPAIAAQRRLEPEQLRKSLTGDLDWIVMKALEKERGRRYETASGFARDVERYLNDEAVEASPPSARYRLWKLVRKNRTAIVTAASFAVVLLVATTISTWQAFRAHTEAVRANRESVRAKKAEDTAKQALADETRQRRMAVQSQQKAEKARNRARQALDSMTSSIIGESLATQNEITAEQKKFLDEVLTFYKEFAADQGHDQMSRSSNADAAHRVGRIELQLGRNLQAIEAFEAATGGYSKLSADFPAVAKYRHQLSVSYRELGYLRELVGRVTKAENDLRMCLELVRELPSAHLSKSEHRIELATSLMLYGSILTAANKPIEAEQAYRDAIAAIKELPEPVRSSLQIRYRLASIHDSLGRSLLAFGKPDEALDEMMKCEALLAPLPLYKEGNTEYLVLTSRHRMNLGMVYLALNHPLPAEMAFGASLSGSKILVDGYPTIPSYLELFCASETGSGFAMNRLRVRLRLIWNGFGLEGLQKLVKEYPDAPRYRELLRNSHQALGERLANMQQMPEAEVHFQQALELSLNLIAEFPEIAHHRYDLANYYDRLGQIKEIRGEESQAEALYQKAMAMYETLAAEFPRVDVYRRDLAKSYSALGSRQLGLGRMGEGERHFRRALDILRTPAVDPSNEAKRRRQLAICHFDIGLASSGQGIVSDADGEYQYAVAIFEKLAAQFPDRPLHRHDLAIHLSKWGQTKSRQGKTAEAEQLYRKAVDVYRKLTADYVKLNENYQVKEEDYLRDSGLVLHDRELAMISADLGSIYLDLGQFADAEIQYQYALTMTTHVGNTGSYANYLEQQKQLAICHFNYALALSARGNQVNADEQYQAALTLFKKLVTEFPDQPAHQRDLASYVSKWGQRSGID